MRISDWSSDVCSSDLLGLHQTRRIRHHLARHFQKGAADIQRIECFRRDDASSFRVRCLTFQEVPDELLAPFRDLRHGLRVFYRVWQLRSAEPTSELQSLMRISYAVFCLKKNKYEKICTTD